MDSKNFEKRIAALEEEVAVLKAKIEGERPSKKAWWEEIVGAFRGDPIFKEVIDLGREYRKSQAGSK
jgi:hypothetical protein